MNKLRLEKLNFENLHLEFNLVTQCDPYLNTTSFCTVLTYPIQFGTFLN